MSPLSRREFLRSGAAFATGLAAGRWLTACATVHPPTPGPGLAGSPPDLLLDALRSDDIILQADAARLLGELRSPDAVGPLVEYVHTSRRYVKTAGFDALARIGDRSVCSRIRGLVAEPKVYADDYWYGRASVQVAAALALLALGDESAADFLLADDPDSNKDWALSTWFGPTVMALPDAVPTARKLKDTMTASFLAASAKHDPGQLVVICDTLGMLRTEEAESRLVQLLGHMSRYVRARAAVNLLRVSVRPRTIVLVMRVAEQDATLFARVKASEALCLADVAGHRDCITDAVQSAEDEFDRAAAVEALGICGLADSAALIAQQLRRPDPYVRLCAVEALDRIGTRRALRAVAPYRDDADMRVRLQVEKCLAAHPEGGLS